MNDASNRENQKTLSVLQRAVNKALDRKRRLGQYAVFWKDGKPFFTEGDAPSPPSIPLTVQEDPEPYGDK